MCDAKYVFVLAFSVLAFSIITKCVLLYLHFPYLCFPVLAISAPPRTHGIAIYRAKRIRSPLRASFFFQFLRCLPIGSVNPFHFTCNSTRKKFPSVTTCKWNFMLTVTFAVASRVKISHKPVDVSITLFIFVRPFVKRFALCYRSVVLSCPVCL